MHIKQAGLGILLLLVLAAVIGFLPYKSWTPAPLSRLERPLLGEMTPMGDYLYAEATDYYVIKASFPATTTLWGAADEKARLTIERGLAEVVAQFKKDGNFDTLTPEDVAIQHIGPDHKYMLTMEYVTYHSPGYVSYVYSVYADTLGAHPNGTYMTFVFDNRGERVALAQLFPANPNWLEELSHKVSEEVVVQMKVRTRESDVSSMFFPEGVAPQEGNFSNFALDGDTLVVMLPPYQVAPYVMGSFTVRVPLADLQ
jgi:hypothetical protein